MQILQLADSIFNFCHYLASKAIGPIVASCMHTSDSFIGERQRNRETGCFCEVVGMFVIPVSGSHFTVGTLTVDSKVV